MLQSGSEIAKLSQCGTSAFSTRPKLLLRLRFHC